MRHQTLKGVTPTQLVSRTNVRQRRPSKMFRFEQLPDENITVVHECTELSSVRPQALDGPSSINNVRVWRVREQLFDVRGPERHIAFAKYNELCFVMR